MFRLPFGAHGIPWKRLKIGPRVITVVYYIYSAFLQTRAGCAGETTPRVPGASIFPIKNCHAAFARHNL